MTITFHIKRNSDLTQIKYITPENTLNKKHFNSLSKKPGQTFVVLFRDHCLGKETPVTFFTLSIRKGRNRDRDLHEKVLGRSF